MNAAHKYLKKWPFSLSMNPDSANEEGDFEAHEEEEALVNEAEDAVDLQDDAGNSLPKYSGKEIAAQG